MSRNAPILFCRVGKTKTGRSLFKLCHPGGKVFGRAFCINGQNLIVHKRKSSHD